jgi:hypothetical protein
LAIEDGLPLGFLCKAWQGQKQGHAGHKNARIHEVGFIAVTSFAGLDKTRFEIKIQKLVEVCARKEG